MTYSDPDLLEVAEEVRDALSSGLPVVALESTILAHGLPRPQNLEVGAQMQAAVRNEGAVPATIAILDGHARIGLSQVELERVCLEDIAKAGVRDLAFHLAQSSSAATTVSSTLRLAGLASIPVMATGGIGGVHRDSWRSGDISSDLVELSRHGLAVVCSGAKSILDLAMTMEHLETLGVPVAGYRVREFPAFYSRSSGLRLEHSVSTVSQAARFVSIQRDLGEESVLLVQPVPPEQEIPWEEVQEMVSRARNEAAAAGVKGKELTPFLLARLVELSDGRTLVANRALALNNCRLAGRLSSELAK